MQNDGGLTPAQARDRIIGLTKAGDFVEAAKLAEAAIAALPREPLFWFLLGCSRASLTQFNEAEAAFVQALSLNPEDPGTHFNLGCVLHRQGHLHRAIAAFSRSTELDPTHAQAFNNLGVVQRQSGLPQEAITSFRNALACDPAYRDAALNLASAVWDEDRSDEALTLTRRVLANDPGHAAALGLMLRLKCETCDFTAFDDFEPVKQTLGIENTDVPLFTLLQMEDHPARQLIRAQNWIRAHVSQSARTKDMGPQAQPRRKLRIGYFSANFHDHPGLFLMAGLFRNHDKSRFDVMAYSLGPPRPSTLRDSLTQEFSAFHDAHALPDAEIAALARAHEIDIAIDHDGHLRGARPGVFAHRAAPLQICYLGFSGSPGAPFFDYLVADKTVVPDAQRAHYAEPILFMPDTYFPPEQTRPAPPQRSQRADHGLPDGACVLCCFNAPSRIGRTEFAIWMRVMAQSVESILWLKTDSEHVRNNLRSEAEARGVDPRRLVFAGPVRSRAAHLERYDHADLFLDTFHYNAHTTASDALWAGLPVITKCGSQFASRVAASLLKAAGMSDLITATDSAYQTLILSLIQDRDRIAQLKSRLRANRSDHPLFDTTRYVRHFEAGLQHMQDRRLRGAPPADIRLT